MRPVDGDRLKQVIKQWIDTLNRVVDVETCEIVLNLIDVLPTLTPPNEWISVEDAVPDPGVRVLAANGNFVGEAYMASNGAWMRHDGFPWEVDAWMPMPDRRPPEGEGDT